MWVWIKNNTRGIITALVSIVLCIYLYSCESQVNSLDGSKRLVNRAELQLELDQIIGMAELRMLSLDRQDAFRNVIIQNSILVAQGQPFNPIGLITAIAGIYGAAHAATKSTKAVVKAIEKRKVNNG